MMKRQGGSFALAMIGCYSIFLWLASPPIKAQESQQQIRKLVKELKSHDPIVIQKASNALVKIGAPALPALKKALKDKDPLVRSSVATALEQTGSPGRLGRPTSVRGRPTVVREGFSARTPREDRIAAQGVSVAVT